MRMGKMSIAFFDAKEYDRQSFVISNDKASSNKGEVRNLPSMLLHDQVD